MIFPADEKVLYTIFHCPVCDGTYLEQKTGMSCLVLHGPGSCCHHADIIVSVQQLVELKRILGPSYTTGSTSISVNEDENISTNTGDDLNIA